MATTYITRTPAGTGNQNTFTLSYWLKRSGLADGNNFYSQSGGKCYMEFTSGDVLNIGMNTSGTSVDAIRTDRVFRDPSAWYHIVLKMDTTQSTEADRMRLYINGVEEVAANWSTTNYPAEDADILMNTTLQYYIGSQTASTNYFNGVMSHVQFVDGTALAPTEFGEFDSTSGIWKIKTTAYATPGTNGFYLKMEDRTNLDLDSSSNAFTFTTSGNLIATYDNPSNNFATFSPLWYIPTHPPTFTNINNDFIATGNTSVLWATSTLGAVGGKYYAEFEIDKNDGRTILGISQFGSDLSAAFQANSSPASFDNSVGYKTYNGDMIIGPSSTTSSYGNAVADAEILGMAWDLDNKRIYFSIDGVWQNSADPSAGSGYFDYSALTGTGQWGMLVGDESGSYNDEWMANWGNGYFGTTAVTSANADGDGIGAFEYAVPTGFYALCTKNIKTYGG